MKILAELLERVTRTNKIQSDTDATIAGAEEEENYQNEVEAEDDNENHEDSNEDDEEVYYFYDCMFCKFIFCEKSELVEHIGKCDKK